MNECALAFNNQNVVVLMGEYLTLDGPADEIGDDAIDGASVPFNHDAGLAGGDELRIVTGTFERPRSLFAARASRTSRSLSASISLLFCSRRTSASIWTGFTILSNLLVTWTIVSSNRPCLTP